MIPEYSIHAQNAELQNKPFEGMFDCKCYTSQGRVNPMHFHTCYSMEIMLHGRMDYINSGFSVSSDTPIILMSFPFMPHSLHAWEDTEYQRYVLYAYPELIDRFAAQYIDIDRLKNVNLIWAKPCVSAFEQVTLLCRQLELTKDKTIAALLLSVFMQILLGEVDAGRGEIVRMPRPYINDILKELADSLDSPPSIDDVCRRVGVGRSKLQRDFKAVTGTTWHHHLTTIRMVRARELLLDGDSILHTSLACGYSSESHFIMAFRKYYGETPGEVLCRAKEHDSFLGEKP